MYLGRSRYWWAYLGIRSNPAIVPEMRGSSDRAVFFDHPSLIPSIRKSAKQKTRYFYLLWDGLSDESAIEKIRLSLGPGADLTALVVGDCPPRLQEKYKVENLYAEGALVFNRAKASFDARTSAILLGARIKTLMMPLKNTLQRRGAKRDAIQLLFGRRRVVFCGTYGMTPKVLRSLCERHTVDFRLFESYEFYCNDPSRSLDSYKRYLRSNALFLSGLYDRSEVGETFFLSAIHLLAREYFLERIRAAGLNLYTNEFTSGVNINVYTTPFYAQHVFIDFGSTVGSGNYPRLVDLRFFKKNFIEIGMRGEMDELLSAARSGKLDEHFEKEWELKAPALLKAMEKRRIPS
jgi:hypothetical protein